MQKAVLLATTTAELGLVPANTAKATAQEAANQQGQSVTLRDPVSDKVLSKVRPTKAKPAKGKAKVAPAKKATTARTKPGKAAPKATGPRGMVTEILRLASRAKGVTPAELNALTGWKGAPWKWLFSNPKGTGYCDRWGYKVRVLTPTRRTLARSATRSPKSRTTVLHTTRARFTTWPFFCLPHGDHWRAAQGGTPTGFSRSF
jgi:hypothetical protein